MESQVCPQMEASRIESSRDKSSGDGVAWSMEPLRPTRPQP